MLLVGAAVLLVLTQIGAQWWFGGFGETGHLINEAGRQRMFSQQLTKSAILLRHAADAERFNARMTEMKQALQAWSTSHGPLVEAMPSEIRDDLSKLLESEGLTQAAERVVAEGKWSPASGASVPTKAVEALIEEEQAFLGEMERLVNALDAHYSQQMQVLLWFQSALGLLILILLWLELRTPGQAPVRVADEQGLGGEQSPTPTGPPTGEIELTPQQQLTGQFLARMSHELRTPMTAILGYTDLLQAGVGDDAERQKSLRTIHEQGVHLLGVIEDLLELFTLDGTDLRSELTPFEPSALVRVVERQMAPRAQASGLSLKFDLDPDLPRRIVSDPRRLRHLLGHLVENAIKFTARGRVSVRIWVGPTDIAHPLGRALGFQRPVELFVEVVDTGVGIEPDHIQRIFEPFAQEDESLARHYTGAGLGLAVSRHLTRLMGGDITVSSRPGEGSTFTARVIADQADAIMVPSEETPAPNMVAPDRTLSVLVADDETLNRAVICAILKHRGMRVEEASNGREAIDRAQGAASTGRPFDLILMDLEMPVMDGRAAALQLRASGYERPIVALVSSNDSTQEKSRALDSLPTGFDGVVGKPIRREALLKAVGAACSANTPPSSGMSRAEAIAKEAMAKRGAAQ